MGEFNEMKSACIAGASGFIGRNLVQRLKNEGFSISVISREDFKNGKIDEKIKNCSLVINLVGESIAGLWTRQKRKRIYESRVHAARKLVNAINLTGDEVKLFIQVSGVGIYDHRHVHTEESKQYDPGFLSRVILEWEGELKNISNAQVRVVVLRLGVVLDKKGGLLKQIMYLLRLGPGFGVKSEDYFPYVHMDDLMSVFVFCIKKHEIAGIVNVVAPGLTKINQFFIKLMEIKNKKRIIWINVRFLSLICGESGSLITSGQKVVPERLKREGFVFRYDNIEDALNRACN